MNFTLSLTHACNLSCRYCYACTGSRRAMSRETLSTAIRFAVGQALNRQDVTWKLGFFGGEPLLEWGLLAEATEQVETLAARHGAHLTKTLTTNATLLNGDTLAWLDRHSVYVGLSVDGHRAMHDACRRFRNGRSSHARATRHLEHFRGPNARGEVILTLDPRNIRHLPAALDWLSERGIANLSLNPNFYVPWDAAARRAWRKGYEHAADLYIRSYRQSRYFRINFIDGKIKTHIRGGYDPCAKCLFGHGEFAVAPSGNIYPCERLIGEDSAGPMCIGNVRDGFDTRRHAALARERGNTTVACRSCSLHRRCMNWCGCINYTTTGAINTVAGVVCHHERMAIDIADRVGATLYAEANPYFLRKFYPDTGDPPEYPHD